MQNIIIMPDRRLRTIASTVESCSSEELSFIDSLRVALADSGGIGLAATQLGINKRIAVIDINEHDGCDPKDPEAVTFGRFEMINPSIIERNGKEKHQEGCLSIPGFKEMIERDAMVTVTYSDRDGSQKKIKAAGLLAACIQHEIDHLNGILFIDHLSGLKRDIVVRKLTKSKKLLLK